MKKSVIAFIAASFVLAGSSASAIELGGLPTNPLNIGVHVGVNTSNMSNNLVKAVDNYNWTSTDWGTGFTGGVTVDINLRKYLALQPGFFFQSRNMEYRNELSFADGILGSINSGHVRTYNFNVPILVSLRMDLTSLFGVHVEAGPYFQWALGDGTNKYTSATAEVTPENYKCDVYDDHGALRTYDWGFKFGGGLTFMSRYTLSIHYMAGCRNIFKQPANVRHDLSGHNKSWDVTVGYNFM